MYRLGVDLGGTNIAVAVVDENYNIVGRAKTKTDAHRPAAEIPHPKRGGAHCPARREPS